MSKYKYDDKPLLVYWELTRSCKLACKHCRAEAIHHRHPLELKTQECYKVIDDMMAFEKPYPHLIITGGDPLSRPDMMEIIAYAREKGFPVSVAPSGTYAITREVLEQWKALGVQGMSLSLDGSTEERHDTFRGEEHCFEWTMNAAKLANEVGMPLQFNTLVCAETKDDLENIYDVISRFDIMRWSVFFLIPVGRGEGLKAITPGETEDILHWLYDKMKESPFPIKTTEAHHFRRVAYERMRDEGIADDVIKRMPVSRGFGVRDGNGIMFMSHTGEINPSGFLPESAGNVRKSSPVDLYRHSGLFKNIREVDRYVGKCGYCEFNEICGGSRARAWAWAQNPNGSDPLCPYKPKKNLIRPKVMV